MANTLARTGQLRSDHRDGRFGGAGVGAPGAGIGCPTPSGVVNIVTGPRSRNRPPH